MRLGASQAKGSELRVGERYTVLDRAQRPRNLRVEHPWPRLQAEALAEEHHVLLPGVQHPKRALLECRAERGQIAQRDGIHEENIGPGRDLEQAELDA